MVLKKAIIKIIGYERKKVSIFVDQNQNQLVYVILKLLFLEIEDVE